MKERRKNTLVALFMCLYLLIQQVLHIQTIYIYIYVEYALETSTLYTSHQLQ